MRTDARSLPGLTPRRQQQFLTPEEVALKAGVSRQTISRLERGEKASLKTIRKIARALGCEPKDLVEPQPGAVYSASGNESVALS